MINDLYSDKQQLLNKHAVYTSKIHLYKYIYIYEVLYSNRNKIGHFRVLQITSVLGGLQ